MNVITLTVILLVVFFIIQKNSKFQDKDYPLNSASRGEPFLDTFRKEFDIPTKREKRVRLIDALKNISLSDKVILTDVEEKWSLNKNTIDIETNRKSLEIVKDVMKNIGLLSKQQFFTKDIENVYVMKDKNGNFRTIISCFIHDIQNFHTIKLIIDVVYFDNIMYINHIDIDESGIKNVLQHYDIKYKSMGILTNYNQFDQNVEVLIDNYYKEKYKVIPLNTKEILDLSNTFSFTSFKKKIMPKGAPSQKSPFFCNKEKFDWDSKGINLPDDKCCTFNNPSIKHYPYEPRNIPGGIINNVDVNQYSWLKDPVRGHSVTSSS